MELIKKDQTLGKAKYKYTHYHNDNNIETKAIICNNYATLGCNTIVLLFLT